jgi:hypothetical protein
MKNLTFAAIAAVMSCVAFTTDQAQAQGYYGYPSVVPVSRYVPASHYSGYPPVNRYPQPVCVPTTVCPPVCPPICPPNYYPSGGQFGRPGYSVPGNYGAPVYSQPSGGYSVPVYSQPSGGYSTPVYYHPAETYPNGGFPNGGYPAGNFYGAPVNPHFVPGVGHFSVEDEPTGRPAAPARTIENPFYN